MLSGSSLYWYHRNRCFHPLDIDLTDWDEVPPGFPEDLVRTQKARAARSRRLQSGEPASPAGKKRKPRKAKMRSISNQIIDLAGNGQVLPDIACAVKAMHICVDDDTLWEKPFDDELLDRIWVEVCGGSAVRVSYDPRTDNVKEIKSDLDRIEYLASGVDPQDVLRVNWDEAFDDDDALD